MKLDKATQTAQPSVIADPKAWTYFLAPEGRERQVA